jgi:hypothetical protein
MKELAIINKQGLVPESYKSGSIITIKLTYTY